jgi:hypothetical protein
VTRRPPQPGGNPSASINQPSAISSSALATGDIIRSPEFWSQAPASQFAANAAGSVPPVTKPK